MEAFFFLLKKGSSRGFSFFTVHEKLGRVIRSSGRVPGGAGIPAAVAGYNMLNHEHAHPRAELGRGYAHLRRHVSTVERPRYRQREVTLGDQALD